MRIGDREIQSLCRGGGHDVGRIPRKKKPSFLHIFGDETSKMDNVLFHNLATIDFFRPSFYT
ncbi:hypothetical protein WI83_27455 [Burkholderia ubonensis]|nr:hypothetical protein WI83_27455 [Burkholderia ubonensis]